MPEIENYLTEAIDNVIAWDLSEDLFADAVNAEARTQAGCASDVVWRCSDDGDNS
jgi:hypothetical protein